MVRVDFFKESGKWYTTEAVRWTLYESEPSGGGFVLLQNAFALALLDHLVVPHEKTGQLRVRLSDMVAVCLEPYHEHSVPLMMPVERAIQNVDKIRTRLRSPPAIAWANARERQNEPLPTPSPRSVLHMAMTGSRARGWPCSCGQEFTTPGALGAHLRESGTTLGDGPLVLSPDPAAR